MKKKIIIILSVILVISAVLFVPIPKESYDDGGTRVFEALTYKLVKWNRFQSDDVCYNSTRIYFGKDKNKSIDELWMMIDPQDDGESTGNKTDGKKIKFRAKALEVNGAYILVEPVEGSRELNSASKINIPKSALEGILIDEGDMLEIEYDGMIAETYPAVIEKVYSVIKLGIYNLQLEHNGRKEYMNKADSEYIRGVLDAFEVSDDMAFTFPKDYTISYGKNTFGRSGVVYYNVKESVVGDTSVGYISQKEREKFNSVLESYFADDSNEFRYPIKKDGVQAVRIYHSSNEAEYPYAVAIKSRGELNDFLEKQLEIYNMPNMPFPAELQDDKLARSEIEKATEKYDDAYFKNKALVLAMTSEGSGSNYYIGASIDGNTLVIERAKPEVGTCDMAYWCVIYETDKTDPILSGEIQINITEG